MINKAQQPVTLHVRSNSFVFTINPDRNDGVHLITFVTEFAEITPLIQKRLPWCVVLCKRLRCFQRYLELLWKLGIDSRNWLAWRWGPLGFTWMKLRAKWQWVSWLHIAHDHENTCNCIENFLCPGTESSLVAWTFSLNSHNNLKRKDVALIPILQVKKLRHGEIEWLTRGDTARKWWTELDLAPLLSFVPLLLYYPLPNFPHPRFLRHRWDGRETKARASLGKEAPAKGSSLSLCLDTSQLCPLEFVFCKCGAAIHVLVSPKVCLFLKWSQQTWISDDGERVLE